jgi:hypothetical protein
MSHGGGRYLLVVRESVLRDFVEMLKNSDVEVFHIQDENTFARMIGKLTAPGTRPDSKPE